MRRIHGANVSARSARLSAMVCSTEGLAGVARIYRRRNRVVLVPVRLPRSSGVVPSGVDTRLGAVTCLLRAQATGAGNSAVGYERSGALPRPPRTGHMAHRARAAQAKGEAFKSPRRQQKTVLNCAPLPRGTPPSVARPRGLARACRRTCPRLVRVPASRGRGSSAPATANVVRRHSAAKEDRG
jgi:hypothetical protein